MTGTVSMKIGINGYETVVGRFGQEQQTGLVKRVGSSEYIFRLLDGFYKISQEKASNQFFIFLPDNPGPDLFAETANWKYVVVPKKSIWTLIDLSWYFLTHQVDLDVFFSPTHYLPIYCSYPCVISVMDLSFLHFPDFFQPKDLWQLRLWTKYSLKRAKRVLTISNASKNDIIKYYGVEDSKITVTYPGIKMLNGKNMSKVLEKYQIKKPYLLFVGTIQPRKNIVRLIEAFSQIVNNRNLQLTIVGRPGWMYEEIYKAPQKYGVKDKVKFLDNVSEEDLPYFYQNALCFILPSLYEGFGLPILEAMQNGCPVITSNISSMPEAGGEAALYVDPQKVEDIKKKIEMVITNEKLRSEMVKKGYEQIKKFSWEKTARETLKVLEEVAKGGEKNE